MPQTDFERLAHPTWVKALEPQLEKIARIESFLEEEISTGKNILPSSENRYRALEHDINSTKVLILGQDPYPTPGHAMGLAFSAAPSDTPLPKSLKNIFTELQDDLAIPPATSPDLTAWHKQGVMLLNTSLSVEARKAGSHKALWTEIINAIVGQLVSREIPLVSILWGKPAQTYAPALAPFPVIESPHPSPLSAYRGFFGSQPFSICNKLLVQQGASPINWELKSAA